MHPPPTAQPKSSSSVVGQRQLRRVVCPEDQPHKRKSKRKDQCGVQGGDCQIVPCGDEALKATESRESGLGDRPCICVKAEEEAIIGGRMNFKRTNDIILHFVWIRSWEGRTAGFADGSFALPSFITALISETALSNCPFWELGSYL